MLEHHRDKLKLVWKLYSIQITWDMGEQIMYQTIWTIATEYYRVFQQKV